MWYAIIMFYSPWPAFFVFKKITLFIYFLNLYFFIKMDMCRHLIGDI